MVQLAGQAINLQVDDLRDAAAAVAQHMRGAATPPTGAVPVPVAASAADVAAAGAAETIQTKMAVLATELAGKGPQIHGAATRAGATLRSQDANNGAKIQALSAGLRDERPPTPDTPATASGQPNVPAGHVIVCEPYAAGGGFVCQEWYLDGSINHGWSPTDISGGYP